MIVPDGHMKVLNGPYREKQYKAWWKMPGGASRVSRRYFRTATGANEYGQRVAERYNRMYAKQGEGEKGEGEVCEE